MKTPHLITGLELGTRHFVAAVGELQDRDHLILRAVEAVPAQGVEKGVFSHPLECSDAVARLIRQVERSTSLRVSRAMAAVHGNHLKSYNVTASIPVPDPETGISRRDVERVLTTCRTLSLDYDRQILHTFERGFSVDGQSGIKDPVGLSGNKLAVELHLVTTLTMAIQNLTRVLNRAGLEVEELVLPGLAAAEAVLSELDQDIGVTLIRIGELQTEALLFMEGAVRETFLIPWGTDSLADSLSRTLKLPSASVEQLLGQVRSLDAHPSQEGRPDWSSDPLKIKVGSLTRSFPQGQVVHLLGLRVKDFLTRLCRRLEESPYFRESASGIVMVGALPRLEGFLEMAEGVLNMPVRLGSPRQIEVAPHVSLGALHTTAVGLVRHGARKPAFPISSRPLPTSPWGRWTERARHILEEYF